MSPVAETPRSRAQSAASVSLSCPIQILALIAGMGRTSGKKPGRNSSSALPSSATASSGSPSARASSAIATYHRYCRSLVTATVGEGRGDLEVPPCAIEIAGLDFDLAQTHVQVGGCPGQPPIGGLGAVQRTRVEPSCRTGSTRRHPHVRENACAAELVDQVPGRVQARHRLAERLQRGRHVTVRPGCETEESGRAAAGEMVVGAGQVECSTACSAVPAMSPRACARDAR